MATSWPAVPAEMATSPPREDIPNGLSISNLLGNSYPPPAAPSPSIPALLDFNFPTGPVSQPISFIRPAVGVPNRTLNYTPFESGNIPDYRQDFPGLSSTEIGIAEASAECDTFSSSDSGSPDTSLCMSGTPQEGSPDSFSAGILDGPDNALISHTRPSSYAHLHSIRPTFDEHCSPSSSERKWHTYLTSVTDNYGMDCGRSDTDLGKNDDHSAIDVNNALDMIQSQTGSHVSSPRNFQAGKECIADSKYNYYALPVPINIPRYLSPLPTSLLKVPINLMYFHHFLNHTARVLVPHDCQDNPFSSVLPSMAIGDPNLLNLMLAYSASHRARFLGQPEPANRIALWVSDVFPSLRIALEDPHEKVTDSHLATAIMLLSLKIVSPSTFEVPVPWQSHLQLARDLFLARQFQMAYPGNRVGAFLTRWIGYLDILGSLSCRHHQPPLLAYYSVLSTCCADEEWDEFAVDCFTGFTPRTGLLLMQLGGLVHQCDNERFDDLGRFLPEWNPSPDIERKAESLIADWDTLDMHAHTHETHYQDSESSDMIAVDRAFRYAGLLHLYRRVLAEPSDSSSILRALDGLMQAVTAIRSGATAEAGVLFPIFTAGCETLDLQQRIEIKERLEVLEGTGMKQIQNARRLMERSWDTELPWIAFSQGEFLG
ncbi:fungal-specific transcription factor domain-containing protein [Aspergillus cavernicola]|uniref:Fungal-specific transcription factor domain-containing protein n=1 Tax=Aspergillus cavernicola TaxID=176166 RepID=A0ABR4I209_9EURO